jgi:hypothetical protein
MTISSFFPGSFRRKKSKAVIWVESNVIRLCLGALIDRRQGGREANANIGIVVAHPNGRITSCSTSTSMAITARVSGRHQTGWTGVVAKLIELFGLLDSQSFRMPEKSGAFAKSESNR